MSPQTAPPVNEVATDRGALLDQMTRINKLINDLDGSLDRGQVIAAREYSRAMRSELTGLALLLGLT